MSCRSSSPAVIAVALCAATCLVVAQPKTRPMTLPVIRQVDHILIESSDPNVLFEFFTRTLELPVAWPLTDYSGFTSGGAAAGNVNIEILRYVTPTGSAAEKPPTARFIGVALEPTPLVDSLQQLRARGVVYNTPEPYPSTLPDGSRGTSWTTVALPQLSKSGLSVFLCEYSPAFLNVAIRRNQLGGQLVLNAGGPLGVESVGEIILALRDFKGERSRWQELLAPIIPSSKAVWQLGNGPAIQLVPGRKDQILRMILNVKSLDRAKLFLREKHLLGPVSATEIALDPTAVQGLDIRIR